MMEIDVSGIMEYVRKIQEESDRKYRTDFPGLWSSGQISRFIFSMGKKYFKIIDCMSNGQSSVFCFVGRTTGDIYKADTWSRPAKHIRGNIFSETLPLTLGSLYIRHQKPSR